MSLAVARETVQTAHHVAECSKMEYATGNEIILQSTEHLNFPYIASRLMSKKYVTKIS